MDTPVAVITGAARKGGIGWSIAEQLIDSGHRVVVADLARPMETHLGYESSDADDLKLAANELSQRGEVVAVPCDVRREEDVQALYAAAIEAFGRVDVAVQNAGVAVGLSEITDLSLEDWQLNLDVMATGVFLCAREAARIMIRQGSGGRIINMSSQAGKTGTSHLGAYATAKFGVIGLTQTMASELGRHAITVNAVCPGVVSTPLLEVEGGVFDVYPRAFGMDPEQYKRRLLRQIPLARFSAPNEVAAVVRFLASEAASFITGEAVNVTGGQEVH